MWFNKKTNVAALLGAAVLISPSVLASDNPYNVLIPCGESVENQFPVVPVGTCQEISGGSFTVAALGAEQPGVKIGFSQTFDCMETYTPSYEELSQWQQSQTCIKFTLDTTKTSDTEGHQQSYKRDSEDSKDFTFFRKRDQPGRPLRDGDLNQRPLAYVMLVKA